MPRNARPCRYPRALSSRRIHIGEHYWMVYFWKQDTTYPVMLGAVGLCDWTHREIHIRHHSDYRVFRDTIVHELLHAYGVEDEKQVRIICRLLRDLGSAINHATGAPLDCFYHNVEQLVKEGA